MGAFGGALANRDSHEVTLGGLAGATPACSPATVSCAPT
jgi:hypothetical protein